MKKLVLIGMVLLMVVASVIGCGGSASEPEPILAPKPELNLAPNFQLRDLNGNLVSLRDFRGKVVFLNFWASWCGPCRYEMPSMEVVYRDYKDKGFEILAVNVQEDQSKVEAFVGQAGFSFPVLLDSSSTVFQKYLVRAFPTTCIIDSQGVLRARLVGALDWTDPSFRKIIEDLLSERD